MPSSSRIPEIDALRVLALILMILYHAVYDLDFYTSASVDVNSWLWTLIGKLAALLFIFLSGVSAGLSRHPVKNGLKLLFWALFLTLSTYIAMPATYIRFGILHFLGIMLLVYPFFKNRSNGFLIVFSLVAIFVGMFVLQRNALIINPINTPWLLPLGITYPGFSTIDYYPLFPYSGVSVLGIVFFRLRHEGMPFALVALAKANPLVALMLDESIKPKVILSDSIEKMSRHSLLIYIVHQPILLLLLFIFEKIKS